MLLVLYISHFIHLTHEAEWCIYASVNQTTIGSDTGVLLLRYQAIIYTNDGLLSNGPLETNFS